MGLVLIAIAMQMRSGVVFLLPVLVVVVGIRFRERFRKFYMSYLAFGIFMIRALSLSDLQYRSLQKPIPRHSNVALYLVQVMRNADTWNVIWREYPLRENEGLVEQMHRASIGVRAELMHRPWVFVRNYISMMMRFSPRVQRFLMPWSDKISTPWGWLVLLSFLWACWRLPEGSGLRTLSRLPLTYVICCFLGLPILYEGCVRFFGASISLNTLITAIAAYNLIDVARTYVQRVTLPQPMFSGINIPKAGYISRSWNVPRAPSVLSCR